MFRKQYIITAFLALTAVFSGCTNLDEEVFSSIPEKISIRPSLSFWQLWFRFTQVCVL